MPKRKSEAAGDDMLDSSKKKQIKTSTTVKTSTQASRYSRDQERAIAEYTQVTQADKSSAAKALKAHSWHVPNAVNSFFNGSNNASNGNRTKISQVFDGYREDAVESKDELGFDGVTALLGDLDIGLEDIGSLVLFEIVQSPVIGKITREGFIEGFSDSNADTIEKMRNTVLSKRAKLPTDRALFKAVYNHTFTLSTEPPKKAIDLDQATELWQVLFSKNGFEWDSENTPWLEWYTEFLTNQWKKAVNKDLWRQTLAFAEATKKDETLSFWTEESSWPSVIDDFVAWVKAEKNLGSTMQS